MVEGEFIIKEKLNDKLLDDFIVTIKMNGFQTLKKNIDGNTTTLESANMDKFESLVFDRIFLSNLMESTQRMGLVATFKDEKDSIRLILKVLPYMSMFDHKEIPGLTQDIISEQEIDIRVSDRLFDDIMEEMKKRYDIEEIKIIREEPILENPKYKKLPHGARFG